MESLPISWAHQKRLQEKQSPERDPSPVAVSLSMGFRRSSSHTGELSSVLPWLTQCLPQVVNQRFRLWFNSSHTPNMQRERNLSKYDWISTIWKSHGFIYFKLQLPQYLWLPNWLFPSLCESLNSEGYSLCWMGTRRAASARHHLYAHLSR